MAIHDPNLGREHYATAPEVDIPDEQETKVTDEIRDTINAVLDCVDYCFTRLEVSEEDQRKFFDIVEKDILIPTLKETIMGSLKTAMYGTKPSKYPRYPNHVDYHSLKCNRETYELDNLIFSTRVEAEVVLNRLISYIHDYKQVTVGYLYELIGESSPYTAEYYGWTNLDDADIKVDCFGSKYKLCLPRPIRLEESK